MSALPTQNLEPTSPDGRDEAGRFTGGHRLSIGNTGNRNRRKLLESIVPDDIDLALNAIRRVLRDEKAKGNDCINAAREMLDRATGKPASSDMADRIEAIESSIDRIVQHLGVDAR
jgi:hypothetical protein